MAAHGNGVECSRRYRCLCLAFEPVTPTRASSYEVVGSVPYLVTYPDGRMETVYAEKMREIPQLDRIEAMLKALTAPKEDTHSKMTAEGYCVGCGLHWSVH